PTFAVRAVDDSGTVEAIHHETVSRVYPLAVSSQYLSDGLFEDVCPDGSRDLLIAKRYAVPNILSCYSLHFTLSRIPIDETKSKETKAFLEKQLQPLQIANVAISQLVLAVASHDGRWRVDSVHQLHEKWERREDRVLSGRS